MSFLEGLRLWVLGQFVSDLRPETSRQPSKTTSHYHFEASSRGAHSKVTGCLGLPGILGPLQA